VPGLTPAQGHRLAELIAKRLAQARWIPTRGADRVDVAVTAPADDASLEQLAGLIVDEMRQRVI
jgi:hypothetical protein